MPRKWESGKTSDMLLAEQKFGEPCETLLPRVLAEQKTTGRMAEYLGVNRSTLYRWFERIGLDLRRSVEAKPLERSVN